MLLRLAGCTYEEIARQVRRSPDTVRKWFSDPLFAAEFDQLAEERIARARAILIESGPAAAERMRQLLNHRSGMVALGAAKDILDRIGLKPSERHEVTGPDGERLRIIVEYADADDPTSETTPGTAAGDPGGEAV